MNQAQNIEVLPPIIEPGWKVVDAETARRASEQGIDVNISRGVIRYSSPGSQMWEHKPAKEWVFSIPCTAEPTP